MGTEATINGLNDNYGGYEHISRAFDMKFVDWEMLKYVNKSIEKPSGEHTGDWIDGILVGMDYIKNQS